MKITLNDETRSLEEWCAIYDVPTARVRQRILVKGWAPLDALTVGPNKHRQLTKFRSYGVWQNMLQRCENDRHPNFHNYGGRGITVCEAWHSFQAFFNDMGEQPPGLEIDRINNDGNYEPKNCRWVSHQENAQNKLRK